LFWLFLQTLISKAFESLNVYIGRLAQDDKTFAEPFKTHLYVTTLENNFLFVNARMFGLGGNIFLPALTP